MVNSSISPHLLANCVAAMLFFTRHLMPLCKHISARTSLSICSEIRYNGHFNLARRHERAPLNSNCICAHIHTIKIRVRFDNRGGTQADSNAHTQPPTFNRQTQPLIQVTNGNYCVVPTRLLLVQRVAIIFTTERAVIGS
jgi:hypothetical protein